MITSSVTLPPVVPGDTFYRAIPLEVLEPDGRTRRPLTPAELAELTSRYPEMEMEVRLETQGGYGGYRDPEPFFLRSADDEIWIDAASMCLILQVAATRTPGIPAGPFRLRLIDPSALPEPEVWTIARGNLAVLTE